MKTMPSHGRFSGYQMTFGSSPADPYRRQGEVWRSGSADPYRWKLRTLVKGAALTEIANIKLRRLLAQNKSFECADIKVRGSVISCELGGRESVPK